MRTSRFVRALAFTALAALVFTVVSHTQPQQPPPQPPPFRTGVNYVRVDVYPTANGQPVEDLRQEDFEVLEDKVPQKIDAFEHVKIRAAGPQDTRREPNTIEESRAMLEDPDARVFVIYLDFYHVEVAGSHRIRKPLVDVLDRSIGENDLVAVMTPEMGAKDLTFARKTKTIEGILTRYWPWGERDQINSKDPEDDQYRACYAGSPTPNCPDDPRGVAVEMINRRREKRTIDSLQDLVRFLAGVREGRKAILAITDGWLLYRPDPNLARRLFCQVPGIADVHVDPGTGKITTKTDSTNPAGATMYACDADRMRLSQIDDEQEFRSILDEANRANATFYPIDPRGLAVFDTQIVDPNDPFAPMTPPSVDMKLLNARIDSLRTLAGATDGVALVNSNKIEEGMMRVMSDLNSYYLLGYYSSGKLDGKFHSISVRVKRPGVQVRARRGYLALTTAEATSLTAAAAKPPADPAAEADARAIASAIGPLDTLTHEVPVRLQAASGWRHGETPEFWVVGEAGKGEDWMGGGEVSLLVNSAAGETVASGQTAIQPGTRSFRAAVAPSAAVPPGAYTMRVRVKGAGSPSATTNAVTVQLPPAPDSWGAIYLKRGPTTGNKDVPAADLRFRRSERIRVAVLGGEGGAATARLLDRNGKPLPLPVTAGAQEIDGAAFDTADLALTPLAPGDYVIEITTTGGMGGSGGSGRTGGAGRPHGERTLAAFRIVP